MKEIPITKGYTAIIDNEDFDRVKDFKWHYHGKGYAARGYNNNGKVVIEKMHQRIIGRPKGNMEIDHINGNRLDNRRCNLRIVTHQQNTFNSHRKKPQKPGVNPSRYKGVTWRNDRNKWRSCITLNGRKYYLGLYNTEEEAALVYNEAAEKFYGEYARLNKIRRSI
jgi:hypothetical protein